MLATILKSNTAVETTIAIIETFAKVKELTNKRILEYWNRLPHLVPRLAMTCSSNQSVVEKSHDKQPPEAIIASLPDGFPPGRDGRQGAERRGKLL